MTADFLFVSNDNYSRNLGICTYSVMHNMCSAADKVRLFVMDCGISGKNKTRLIKQTKRFDNAEIIFFNIEQQINEVFANATRNWNRAIYGRLFLNEILKQYDIDRIIYLDCDLLMDRPVTELFTMPLDGMCLAGVCDGENLNRKKALGINPEYTYINSGVLVIDVAKWVELDAAAKVIDYIQSYPEKLVYPDQDAINYVLHDSIKVLEPRYNMLWLLCERDVPKMANDNEQYIYSEEQTRSALYHGSIYHFAGKNMWSFYGITPVHAIVFKKYRRLCDWRNEKRRFGGVRNFILWSVVSLKRFLIGEYRLTRQKMNEPCR